MSFLSGPSPWRVAYSAEGDLQEILQRIDGKLDELEGVDDHYQPRQQPASESSPRRGRPRQDGGSISSGDLVYGRQSRGSKHSSGRSPATRPPRNQAWRSGGRAVRAATAAAGAGDGVDPAAGGGGVSANPPARREQTATEKRLVKELRAAQARIEELGEHMKNRGNMHERVRARYGICVLHVVGWSAF